MRFLISFFLPMLAYAAPNVPLQVGVEPPALLSETGLFQQLTPELQPIPELRPFAINQALWVDHAAKDRFLYLPAGAKVGFSPAEAYSFPVGTIFVKNFRMEISHGVFRQIETRLLVKRDGADQWVGFTYKWDGGDARLVGVQEKAEMQLTVDDTAAGGARVQNFKLPTRLQCMQCHNSSMGFVRGFHTQQLNRPLGSGNQLEKLAREGIFDREIGSASQYEAFAAIDDLSKSVEKRARAYLDVNCAHCHNPSPAALCSMVGMDLRLETMNLKDLVELGNIQPGDRQQSSIYQRMESTIPRIRMPYFGSDIVDSRGLALIGEWIDNLKAR